MGLGWEEMKSKKYFSHIILTVLRVLDWRQASSIAQFISLRKWVCFHIPGQQMTGGIGSCGASLQFYHDWLKNLEIRSVFPHGPCWNMSLEACPANSHDSHLSFCTFVSWSFQGWVLSACLTALRLEEALAQLRVSASKANHNIKLRNR